MSVSVRKVEVCVKGPKVCVWRSVRTKPVCDFCALVVVKLMRGIIRSMRDSQVSRHSL
jgi:hypothetical protein